MALSAHRAKRVLLGTAAAVLLGACSSGNAEGGACDRANGNNDCAAGLVCLSPLDVASKTSVCCPRPPATSSVAACAPANQDFQPNPSVDASDAAGGSGGTPGQEAGAETGDSQAGDAASDASRDALHGG